ncbi:MAG: bifunctional UDP-3-O-[3-hydroxymyristoyl] N-acetylglucosamine deacetylase/3-hydroxyacyl-ACP dehydratase [Rikenellaceae bacterium]
MSHLQKTLKDSVSFEGTGLHTGKLVKMTINPAVAGHGVKFKRTDLEGEPVVDALAENVVDTSRSTTIQKGEARVSTVEHVLAALFGCDIDNALIEVNGPEVPIMDGSAIEFVKAIDSAGVVDLAQERVYYEITEKVSFKIEQSGVEITAYPDDHFSINLNIDFNSKVLGNQYAKLDDIEEFKNEVAPCRTFVFLHEIAPLIENNLIKGGDIDNAIVVVENPISDDELKHLTSVFNKENIKIEAGYLNNLELRFANEPARHKMLDVMGDLMLIGTRIKGKIVANKPGHFANTEFAKTVRKAIKRDTSKPSFRYDHNQAPYFDINQIKKLLPHRPPFLLVDKIMKIDADTIVGIKNVTMNEPFFVGHFPSEPVMPGVLIIEAMAQCGGILVLNTVPDPENYSTYFVKIDGVKFKRKVVPGDTLQFELKLVEPIRRGMVVMEAKAYVGDTLATEALLMAQIAKNNK